ncbi:hypothetical protein, partial [Burkholderia cenocepacia]|uniref:hypothetical protein n=1 Tax=Burkholderia cenocepacia TaxID=95486 RepID=UPI001E430382
RFLSSSDGVVGQSALDRADFGVVPECDLGGRGSVGRGKAVAATCMERLFFSIRKCHAPRDLTRKGGMPWSRMAIERFAMCCFLSFDD